MRMRATPRGRKAPATKSARQWANGAEPARHASVSNFVHLALRCVTKEYPNKLDHVLSDGRQVKGPKQLHPAFYGCFDWHSAVHGHWLLAHLLRLNPELPEAGKIRAALSANLTGQNLRAEAEYFAAPGRASFERPYGWAWLLKLREGLYRWEDSSAKEWFAALRPLADAVVTKYLDYLPKLTYPVRVGTHFNTAFALGFALDYARTLGVKNLEREIVRYSREHFGGDADYPASWEPGGDDFLSPSLVEADLMRRVLRGDEFVRWFHRLLPGVAAGRPKNLLTPVKVSDRSDPKIVHLDGLNLSRAWCMRTVASHLPSGDRTRLVLARAAERHAKAALRHVASGDYAGEHWLATFAVYLLSTPQP